MRDYERLLVQPYPTSRVLLYRQPQACDYWIAGLIQNVPLHDISVGIMKNQPDVIEPDNSAKRCGYTRDQGVEVSSARNAPGECQNSLIKFV
jgi:hypothetical protein